ncbi:ERCC4 domain-containing protein [uncultured Clostridium sp.]|uniref:ERCC4 domain-containing protein n=1 Tax=uncultured Clostridium sp. TaxID=59620 RepID=UPI0025D3FF4A|nr:ERCC4 domain-containing protein [uncultured Clostridium sp.]
MRYRYTDKEMKKILDNLVILIDTREQSNQHIIDFFNKKGIKYKTMKLDFGDYSCMLPAGTIDKFTSDIYFTNDFVIERKAGIDELANNLKEDAARFKKELAHLNMYQIKYLIYVEDLNLEENLRLGPGTGYRSQYDAYTLMRRLYCLESEYNTVFVPVAKNIIGSKIANKMQTWVHGLFKHKGFIIEEEGEDID